MVQQTGEAWPDVRVTLSTARPSLDAAPPELLPLKMAVAGVADSGPIDAHDDRSQRILAELDEAVAMSFNEDTPLEDVLKYIKQATTSSTSPRHPDLRRPHRAPGSRENHDLAREQHRPRWCPAQDVA